MVIDSWVSNNQKEKNDGNDNFKIISSSELQICHPDSSSGNKATS